MRSLFSAAVAGLLGLGAISLTINTASADPWDWHHHHHYYHGGSGWDGGAGLAVGGLIGLGVGAAIASQPRDDYEVAPPRSVAWRDHVDYCFDQYRTYDPNTDTYIGPGGREYRCRGSY